MDNIEEAIRAQISAGQQLSTCIGMVSWQRSGPSVAAGRKVMSRSVV